MSDANEEEQVSTVDRIVKELKSGYGDSLSYTHPYKYLFAPSLTNLSADIAGNRVSGTITLTAECQSPHGDNWNTEKSFDVTRADVDRLANIAPKFQDCFSRISHEMDDKLAAGREASRKAVTEWSDAGLPTGQNIRIGKPLSWKKRL